MSEHSFGHLFDEQTKQELIKNIEAAPNSLARISLWYKNGLDWIELNDSSRIHGLELAPFKFTITQRDYQGVNGWILDNYLALSTRSEEEKQQRFLNLDTLINGFEKEYNKSKDKKLIQSKLKEIDKSFVPAGRGTFYVQSNSLNEYYNEKYFANHDAFINSREYDEEPNYDTVYPTVWIVLQIRNGFILGQFYAYLKRKLTQPLEDELLEGDMPQKLLLLFYLGYVENLRQRLPSQNKQAQLWKVILGASVDNIDKKLTALKAMTSKIKTEKNLLFVSSAFDSVGLTSEAEEVRKALKEVYDKENR